MAIEPNMGLIVWETGDDYYQHTQLAQNFYALGAHDHTEGNGKRIRTEAILDNAIKTAKIADGSITEPKYATNSVSSRAIAPSAIGSAEIADSGVGTSELANKSVTLAKLADEIRPMGEVIFWWRPSSSLAVPTGWEIADGRTLNSTQHDFPGGGNVTLPDLRNRVPLGAEVTDLTDAPAIGQTGGSNAINLAHTHTIPAHNHTVDAHRHTVEPHNHVVNSHTHSVPAHRHTVPGHTHTIPAHNHSIPAHSHNMAHIHEVNPHYHGINFVGPHTHDGIAGGQFRTRGYEGKSSNNPRDFALYAANGPTSDEHVAPVYSGEHNHGGNTTETVGVVWTKQTSNANTGSTSGTTDNSATASTGQNSFLQTEETSATTGSTAPLTNNASPFTTNESPGTSSVTLTTSSASGGTSDSRPAFVGLLPLIKVRA